MNIRNRDVTQKTRFADRFKTFFTNMFTRGKKTVEVKASAPPKGNVKPASYRIKETGKRHITKRVRPISVKRDFTPHSHYYGRLSNRKTRSKLGFAAYNALKRTKGYAFYVIRTIAAQNTIINMQQRALKLKLRSAAS